MTSLSPHFSPRHRPLLARCIRIMTVVTALTLLYTVAPVRAQRLTSVAVVLFLTSVAVLSVATVSIVRRWRAGDGAEHVRVETVVAVLWFVLLFFSWTYLRLAQTPGQFEGADDAHRRGVLHPGDVEHGGIRGRASGERTRPVRRHGATAFRPGRAGPRRARPSEGPVGRQCDRSR